MEGDDRKKAPSTNHSGLIISAIVAVVLVSAGAFALSQKGVNPNQPGGAQDTTQQQTMGQPSQPLAQKTLVYGVWTQSGSEVKSLDLSNGAYQTLATLPTDIKKVTILSPDSLLYINQTDNRDHGKSLAVYSIANKKVSTTINAADGYGIDDYVISPDHKKVATWEVAFAPGSGILRGGKSRVYTVDLDNSSVKNLVYDEDAANAVHYPRAILDNGRVFLDTFLPNDPNGGAGWAYGISVAEFNGSGKQDLSQMKNGTYSTQPVLSPDGTKLAFAGYDGSNGPGEANKNGYRQALLTPNTVETLDTNSLTRQKLTNLLASNTYSTVGWDNISGNILLGIIAKDINSMGTYKYNLATSSLEKVNVNSGSSFVANLSSDKSLVGTTDDSPSTLGNLGEGYNQPYNRLAVKDAATSRENTLPLPDALMQYIGLVGSSYFSRAYSVMAAGGGKVGQDQFIDLYSELNAQKNNLQLYTFLLKPSLAPVRSGQQSRPVAAPPSGDSTTIFPSGVLNPEEAYKRSRTLPTLPPEARNLDCIQLAEYRCKERGLAPGTDEYTSCKITMNYGRLEGSGSNSGCYDSPLYLYGPQGQNVKVTVGTYVYNSQPSYTNVYDATLLTDGKMQVNGTLTDSIDYDYNPAIKKITPPTYGTIVPKEQIGTVLQAYGQKLGLNKKEIDDLILSGKNQIKAPYVFVSFFSPETSEDILPLSFTPQPDNYRNIVFYFKQYSANPSFTPQPPVFPTPLNRSGFTAVEISSLVE